MKHYYKDPSAINVKEGDESGMVIIRYMILNSIRRINMLMKGRYGQTPDIILCCDGRENWRKRVFPPYKARRALKKREDRFDWQYIMQCGNAVAEEINEFMPYQVLRHESLEADDLFAAIAQGMHNEYKIVIVSEDKDMSQLLRFNGVEQYKPISDRWAEIEDPVKYTQRMIYRGDSDDDVPNFLSDADTFINPSKRQRKLTEVQLSKWIDNNFTLDEVIIDLQNSKRIAEDDVDTIRKNYKRNKALIDLTSLPSQWAKEVIRYVTHAPTKDRSKVFDYFISHNLSNFASQLGEF